MEKPTSKIGKKEINVDLEKAKKWLSEGAQMSPAVKSLLKEAGVFSA